MRQNEWKQLVIKGFGDIYLLKKSENGWNWCCEIGILF
jgi:hypothetical protein